MVAPRPERRPARLRSRPPARRVGLGGEHALPVLVGGPPQHDIGRGGLPPSRRWRGLSVSTTATTGIPSARKKRTKLGILSIDSQSTSSIRCSSSPSPGRCIDHRTGSAPRSVGSFDEHNDRRVETIDERRPRVQLEELVLCRRGVTERSEPAPASRLPCEMKLRERHRASDLRRVRTSAKPVARQHPRPTAGSE